MKSEIELYRSLFHKSKLKEMDIHICYYNQPILIAVIETDFYLKALLSILYKLGYQADIKVLKAQLVSKGFATRKTLDEKIKILQLIGAIKINKYAIYLTDQSLYFFKKNNTKFNFSILSMKNLERITSLKLLLYENYNTFNIMQITNIAYVNNLTMVIDIKDENINQYISSCKKALSIELENIVNGLKEFGIDDNEPELDFVYTILIQKKFYLRYKKELEIYLITDLKTRNTFGPKVKLEAIFKVYTL